MTEVFKNLTVDLSRKGGSRPIFAVENDTGSRKLKIRITDDGAPYKLEVGTIAIFNYKRADGISGALLADHDEDGVIVTLTSLVLGAPGHVICSLSLSDENKNKITSSDFCLDVSEELYSGEKLDTAPEYGLLLDTLARISEIEIEESARCAAEEGRKQAEAERDEARLNFEGIVNERLAAQDDNITSRLNAQDANIGLQDTKLNTWRAEMVQAFNLQNSIIGAQNNRLDEQDTMLDSRLNAQDGKINEVLNGESVRTAAEVIRAAAETERAAAETEREAMRETFESSINERILAQDAKINDPVALYEIEGVSVSGNLAPTMKLVGKGYATVTNGVIELVEFNDWNTYSVKVPEAGTYTLYANGKQYRCVTVAGDKSTAVGELCLEDDKKLYEVGEDAEYLLVSIQDANIDKLMVNVGESTSLSTKYVLPDAFNEIGQVLPENINGVKNVGDLICRAKLLKADCWFNYSNGKIVFNTDTTQDIYLLKIADVGNYTMKNPKWMRALFLDDAFIPCDNFKLSATAETFTMSSGDNASYLMFTMVKGLEADYHISFGNTVYDEPIYELPEWLKSGSGNGNGNGTVDLADIEGVSEIGQLNSKVELVQKATTITNNNGIIGYEENPTLDTYLLELHEIGKYTFSFSYTTGDLTYNLAEVAEDKQTIINWYSWVSGKTVLDIGEDAKYLVFSFARAHKNFFIINKGESIAAATGYVLPEVFNNYKDGYGEIFPDNIKGIENVGNLLDRLKLYKENSGINYQGKGIELFTDANYDLYLMKIEKAGTYAVTSKKGGFKILALDEAFCINADALAVFPKASNQKYIINDNTKYLLVQMHKEDIGKASLTFGVKTEEKPIYKFADGFVDYTQYGLPVLFLYGDLSLLEPLKNEFGQVVDDKPEATFNYKYGDKSGTCTIKHQGSSSMNYPKKNYTIKFDNAFEAKTGWGSQKKYCLKANYMEFSHARNIVSAKLWGQVVKSRSGVDTRLSSLPNGGAVDGFPVLIVVNDTDYRGLYTFNIPKDKWLFGINGGNDLMVPSDDMTEATRFESATAGQVPSNARLNSFEIEYKPDGVSDDEVWTKLNALIQAVIDNQSKETFETEVGKLIDLDSVVDYICFQALITGHDGIGKNYLLGAFDMGKFFISAYDMDSTYGVHWDGSSYVGADSRPTFKTDSIDHKLLVGVKKFLPEKLKARYEQLRATVMSENNVQLTFYNFLGGIPKAIKDKECELWKAIPNTGTNNISQIMSYYKLRCEYLDKEINKI